MEKAVIVFSGGIDSVCAATYLKKEYDLYGVSFFYGQKANKEIISAKNFAKKIGLKQHKVIDISFMKDLYGNSNVLTSVKKKIPGKFDYSIVVPIRNSIFLAIASAWAFSIDATLVGYGAHIGDRNYPDCRPEFSKKLESAFNQGEIDGIKSNLRKKIKIWSPYNEGFSKSDLIKLGYKNFCDAIFETWSCYYNKKFHCGACESCNNRKLSFNKSGILDRTKYLQ